MMVICLKNGTASADKLPKMSEDPQSGVKFLGLNENENPIFGIGGVIVVEETNDGILSVQGIGNARNQ